MEVHHHPHVEKKSFKEYLLEGLMIFLAVSMGFIAENIREKIAEHETEKKSIEVIVNNLKDDVTRLQNCIKQNAFKAKVIDTAIIFLNKEKLSVDSVEILINLMYKCGPNFDFISNDAAIQEIKSSGSIRLIKNKGILDSILRYEYTNKLISVNQADCNQWSFAAHSNSTKLDYSFYQSGNAAKLSKQKMELATPGEIYYQEQKILLSQCHSQFQIVKFITEAMVLPLLQQQLVNCKKLIDLLEKEYHLKHE
jgi:hypothetical protein